MNKIVITTLIFMAIWLMFTEVELDSFVVGVFFIFAAVALSFWLSSIQIKDNSKKSSIQLIAIPRFVWFFIVNSVLGGLDTAKRAFSMPLDIAPGFIHYKFRYLTYDINTSLFLTLVSLLPGSLYVVNDARGIVIHFLSLSESAINDIEKCEKAVANLYNIQTTNSSPEAAR